MKYIAAAIIIVGAMVVFSQHGEAQPVQQRFFTPPTQENVRLPMAQPGGQCVSIVAVPSKDGSALILLRAWSNGYVDQLTTRGWTDRLNYTP